MKKTVYLLLILFGVLGLLLSACGDSEPAAPSTAGGAQTATSTQGATQAEFELTFALFQPEVSAISKANTAFAQEIEKRTNGRVKIKVMAGGSLLNAGSMYQGVLDGVADMGNSVSVYDPGAFPVTAIAELPCNPQSGWAVSSAFFDFIEHYNPEEWSNVKVLTTVGDAANFLTIGLNKKQIETMEDWSGTSVRSMDAEIVSSMGGTPKDIPMADLYDALSKGVVDGQMGSFEPYKSWKLGEVVDWITVNPAPVQFSAMWYNFMNKKTWDGLPADIQQIITEVGREYSGKIGLAWDDQSVVGAEFVKSLGKTIHVISDEEAAKWTEAVKPVIEKRLAEVAKASGKSEAEVQEMWGYFQERVNYWNGQQAANNVRPLMERVLEVIK